MNLVERLREGVFGSDEAKTDNVLHSYMNQAADRIEALEKQRDELLAALEEAIAGMGGSYAIWSVKAKAAIASVKGGAA